MIVIEIILVVIGIAAVVCSYKISDSKADHQVTEKEDDRAGEEKSLEQWEDEIQDMVQEKSQEMLQEASEALSRLSNEKIMGMDEYSSQVLERMNKNHEEVVFLYNMLNEKEEEMKELVHHIDSVKAHAHDEMATEYQSLMESISQLRERELLLENHVEQQEKAESLPEQASKQVKKEEEKKDEEVEAVFDRDIISLYKKGNSILDISRMLSLGQGEVKLVIDLYENS